MAGPSPALNLISHPIARLQAFVQGLQNGVTQFFAVGSSLFFLIRSQVETVRSNDLQVYGSTDKTTWTLLDTLTPTISPYQNTAADDAPSVLIGTVIYSIQSVSSFFGTAPFAPLVFHRFDTVAGVFLADSSFGPDLQPNATGGIGTQVTSISARNDGKILISTLRRTSDVPAKFTTELYVYDPAGDSWTGPTTLQAETATGSAVPLQQIHDPGSDLTFIFYRPSPLNTTQMRCWTVAADLSFTDAAVENFTGGPYPNTAIGMPVISGGAVVLPYRFIVGGPPVLKVARATIAAAPVFSLEVVDDNTLLPAGYTISQWDQIVTGAWLVLEIAGTLYAFYAVDNGNLDGPASQSFIYYKSYNSGVWSDAGTIFTSAIPGELMTFYGNKVPGFDPVILVGVVDPTLWPDVSSLTDFILFGAAPPVTPESVTIILHGYKLVPNVECGAPALVELPYIPPVKRVM